MKKIMFFTAPWCAGCKTLKPMLKGIPNIEEINAEELPATALQFGVSALPTIVMLDETGEVKRLTGVSTRTADIVREFME